MFEVGKQYQGSGTGRIVEVLYVGETASFTKIIASGEVNSSKVGENFTIHHANESNWPEYVPEVIRRQTRVIVLKPGHDGFVLHYPTDARLMSGEIKLGEIEITHSSKTGLKVEVL